MMPSNNDRELISQYVLKMAIAYGAKETENRLKVYVDYLVDQKIKPVQVRVLVEKAIKECKFFPTIAEILQPLREAQEEERESEIDAAWSWFLANAFNPYTKLPGWAVTIKKHLGWSRVESCYSRDVPFVEKEFRALYKRNSEGCLQSYEDGRNWEKIGSTWALSQGYQFDNGEASLELS